MGDSTDQSGQRQPWQPPMHVGASNYRQETAHVQQQQQLQQHQQFLLSVLLLQKNLLQQQQQRQQHQQQQLGQPWNDRNKLPLGGLPHPNIPQAHGSLPRLPPQPPFVPSINNNIHNLPPPPPPQSIQQQNQEQHQQQNQQQCLQQQHEISTWTEAVGYLIREAEVPRKQKLAGLRVVATRLHRKSLEQPWGLGFVSMNHHQHNAYNNTTSNHHSKSSPHVRNAISDLRFGSRIIVVKSPPTVGTHGSSVPERLFPGDIILAIDGKPVSSWCPKVEPSTVPSNANSQLRHQTPNTTAQMASYLRSIHTVSIVVLRHPEAIQASAIVASAASTTSGVGNQPCRHDPVKIASITNLTWTRLLLPKSRSTAAQTAPKVYKKPAPIVYRNPWYWESGKDGTKVHVPYVDNEGSLEYELYLQQDGSRAGLFLPPIPSDRTGFCEWLSKRKTSWRKRYKVYKFATDAKKAKRKASHEAIGKKKEDMDEDSSESHHVANADFWTHQGFSSFDDWLRTRSVRWHRSYSWNRRKRQKIEEECFQKVVSLPVTVATTNHPHAASSSCTAKEFYEWLDARRVQWKMLRRKRKRERFMLLSMEGADATSHGGETQHASTTSPNGEAGVSDSPRCVSSFPSHEEGNYKPTGKRKLQFLSEEDQQMAFIDEILEEKEKEKQEILRKRAERPPIDILRFFDATQGIPDDVVAHCFAYLDPREHGKLLGINKAVSKSLKDRHGVWQMLCPAHWILPRRPRKPWHELYLTRLRKERERHQKRWDDLLIKCSAALFKRDDLQKIEKLISKAETEFGFDLNYSSGVVCERNSILNLAVIHGRYKVVRWLVDTKHADIETSDRGNFTPLLNAAWSGDRWLVRFFLQRRSNRLVKGTQHYTQGIAPAGFEGKTAEEWAEHKGHPEIAKLIRLGL